MQPYNDYLCLVKKTGCIILVSVPHEIRDIRESFVEKYGKYNSHNLSLLDPKDIEFSDNVILENIIILKSNQLNRQYKVKDVAKFIPIKYLSIALIAYLQKLPSETTLWDNYADIIK